MLLVKHQCRSKGLAFWPKAILVKFAIAFACVVILLAIASFTTQTSALDLIGYIQKVFSVSFVSIYLPLMATGFVATYKIIRNDTTLKEKEFFLEVSHQIANAISTLSLTYTLLGISLGIGSLSQQELSPETVNSIISELTGQFSMAFMTTVVGLPSATLIRALASISMAKRLAGLTRDLVANK